MRLLNLFRRRKLDAQLNDEFAFHLEQLKADLIRQGLSPETAAREAHRQFGNSAVHRESYQDQRGLPWLTDALADLRFGARLLAKSPGFTAIAVLTIALGIGANTAIFSLVNRALFTLAPYPDAHRLVDISRVQKGRIGWPIFASDQYLYYREHAQSFAQIAATRGLSEANLLFQNEVSEVSAQLASDNHFRALGVEPFLGRSFTAEEAAPGGPDVAILSHSLWQSRFHADRAILNQPINLGGKMHTVVGVMPANFSNVLERDLWLPLRARPIYDGENTHVFGRLKPGVTLEQANAEIAQLTADFVRATPRFQEKGRVPETATLAPLWSHMGRSYRPILTALLAATGIILLIGAVNLANLLLARGAGRIREISIRATLGAGRFRIVRQMLVESLLIALLGAALGLAFAYAAIPALLALNPVDEEVFAGATIDLNVLLFSLAISLAAGLFFGLVPAFQAARLNLNEATREGGPKASPSRRTAWFRQSLVVAEIALSCVLLIGAALVLRGFYNLLTVPTGVDSSQVLLANMSLQGQRYGSSEKVNALFAKGLERLRSRPEVESAAISLNVPLERGLNWGARIPGQAAEPFFIELRYNTPGVFSTLRIPILAGRDFQDSDTRASAPVAIISKRFADLHFKNQSPIGRSLIAGNEKITRLVIGVAGDVRQRDIAGQFSPTVYLPAAQVSDDLMLTAHGWFKPVWIVRSRTDQARLTRLMQEDLRAIDPLQPFSAFRTFDDLRRIALTVPRFVAVLIGAFAALALILAAAGIYGVISYQVAQRTQEFGIRMAMGASAGRVVASILRGTIALAALGLTLGLWGGWSLSRLLQTDPLGRIPAADPSTFALASLFLLAIALLASAVPAWRVSRLDPSRALRQE